MYTKDELIAIKQAGDTLAGHIQSEDGGSVEKFQGVYLTIYPESAWVDDELETWPRLADWQVRNSAKLLIDTLKSINDHEAKQLTQRINFIEDDEVGAWIDRAAWENFRDLAVMRILETLQKSRSATRN